MDAVITQTRIHIAGYRILYPGTGKEDVEFVGPICGRELMSYRCGLTIDEALQHVGGPMCGNCARIAGVGPLPSIREVAAHPVSGDQQ